MILFLSKHIEMNCFFLVEIKLASKDRFSLVSLIFTTETYIRFLILKFTKKVLSEREFPLCALPEERGSAKFALRIKTASILWIIMRKIRVKIVTIYTLSDFIAMCFFFR